MRFHSYLTLATALFTVGCSGSESSDGTEKSVTGVNVCRATVSGAPFGGDEQFEMNEVDTTRAPVTDEEKAAWLHTSVTAWRDSGGTFSCLFSDPVGDAGNFRNRLNLYGFLVEGKPPLELDENGEGYGGLTLDYYGPEQGDPEWSCEGNREEPVGRISVKLDSIAITGTTANGLYGRALLEGSFEATCPPRDEEDAALDPVTIRGSWVVEEGTL